MPVGASFALNESPWRRFSATPAAPLSRPRRYRHLSLRTIVAKHLLPAGSADYRLSLDVAAFASLLDNVPFPQIYTDDQEAFLFMSIDSPAAPSSNVPEAGTWAMMMIGFGAVGVAMRSNDHRKADLAVGGRS